MKSCFISGLDEMICRFARRKELANKLNDSETQERGLILDLRPSGAHNLEHATLILGPCNGVFTDQFIFIISLEYFSHKNMRSTFSYLCPSTVGKHLHQKERANTYVCQNIRNTFFSLQFLLIDL